MQVLSRRPRSVLRPHWLDLIEQVRKYKNVTKGPPFLYLQIHLKEGGRRPSLAHQNRLEDFSSCIMINADDKMTIDDSLVNNGNGYRQVQTGCWQIMCKTMFDCEEPTAEHGRGTTLFMTALGCRMRAQIDSREIIQCSIHACQPLAHSDSRGSVHSH